MYSLGVSATKWKIYGNWRGFIVKSNGNPDVKFKKIMKSMELYGVININC